MRRRGPVRGGGQGQADASCRFCAQQACRGSCWALLALRRFLPSHPAAAPPQHPAPDHTTLASAHDMHARPRTCTQAHTRTGSTCCRTHPWPPPRTPHLSTLASASAALPPTQLRPRPGAGRPLSSVAVGRQRQRQVGGPGGEWVQGGGRRGAGAEPRANGGGPGRGCPAGGGGSAVWAQGISAVQYMIAAKTSWTTSQGWGGRGQRGAGNRRGEGRAAEQQRVCATPSCCPASPTPCTPTPHMCAHARGHPPSPLPPSPLTEVCLEPLLCGDQVSAQGGQVLHSLGPVRPARVAKNPDKVVLDMA